MDELISASWAFIHIFKDCRLQSKKSCDRQWAQPGECQLMFMQYAKPLHAKFSGIAWICGLLAVYHVYKFLRWPYCDLKSNFLPRSFICVWKYDNLWVWHCLSPRYVLSEGESGGAKSTKQPIPDSPMQFNKDGAPQHPQRSKRRSQDRRLRDVRESSSDSDLDRGPGRPSKLHYAASRAYSEDSVSSVIFVRGNSEVWVA